MPAGPTGAPSAPLLRRKPGVGEPPARAQCRVEDAPDYLPPGHSLSRALEVRLNGEPELTRITAYDANEGWVRRFQTDDNGKVVIDRNAGCAVEETLRGEVTVRWREPVAA